MRSCGENKWCIWERSESYTWTSSMVPIPMALPRRPYLLGLLPGTSNDCTESIEKEREREKSWVHAAGYVLYKQNSLQTSAGETVIKAWTARNKLSWTQQSNHTRKKGPEEPQQVRGPVKDKKAEVGTHSTQLVT